MHSLVLYLDDCLASSGQNQREKNQIFKSLLLWDL